MVACLSTNYKEAVVISVSTQLPKRWWMVYKYYKNPYEMLIDSYSSDQLDFKIISVTFTSWCHSPEKDCPVVVIFWHYVEIMLFSGLSIYRIYKDVRLHIGIGSTSARRPFYIHGDVRLPSIYANIIDRRLVEWAAAHFV